MLGAVGWGVGFTMTSALPSSTSSSVSLSSARWVVSVLNKRARGGKNLYCIWNVLEGGGWFPGSRDLGMRVTGVQGGRGRA